MCWFVPIESAVFEEVWFILSAFWSVCFLIISSLNCGSLLCVTWNTQCFLHFRWPSVCYFFGSLNSLSYFHSKIFYVYTVHTHAAICGHSAVLTYRTSTAELVVILITTVIRKASTFWRGLWCVLTWRSIVGFVQNMLWFDLSACFTYICDRVFRYPLRP